MVHINFETSGVLVLPNLCPLEVVKVCSSPPIHPMHPINQMTHKNPLECSRSNGHNPAMKTQVLESTEALPITWNELLSMVVVPPLLETPNGAPSFSSCACGWCRTLLH